MKKILFRCPSFSPLKLTFLLSFVLLWRICVLETELSLKTDCSACGNEFAVSDNKLIILSTLNGVLHALDVSNYGKTLWSLTADNNPLLQSTIRNDHDMGPTENGGSYKLVPSLDGTIYLYHVENSQLLPMNPDILLDSSMRLDHDTVVAGGKHVTTVGIDYETGRVDYSCDSSGCQYFDANKTASENAVVDSDEEKGSTKRMVVKRTTHKVRGLDTVSGYEKWNVTVGEHQILLPKALNTAADVTQCHQCRHAVSQESEDTLFRISPSGGIVEAFRIDPDTGNEEILWKTILSTPIVQAWTVFNGGVEEMSVFSDGSEPEPKQSAHAFLYLGVHEDQYYLIPSMEERRRLKSLNALELREESRVYISSLNDAQKFQSSSAVVEPNVGSQCSDRSCPTCSSDEFNSIMSRKQNNPAVGWIVYKHRVGGFRETDHSPLGPYRLQGPGAVRQIGHVSQTNSHSFGVFWKEIIALVAICCIVTGITVRRLLRAKYAKSTDSLQPQFQKSEALDSNRTPSVQMNSVESQASFDDGDNSVASNDQEFKSRFLSDFEPIRCLGAGGFGIVFEARNLMDDCSYAIKRIGVSNRPLAEEKVKREVKALAMLDHVGIVRYYQSWPEHPPKNWQESIDKKILSKCGYDSAIDSSVDLAGRVNSLSNITDCRAKRQDSLRGPMFSTQLSATSLPSSENIHRCTSSPNDSLASASTSQFSDTFDRQDSSASECVRSPIRSDFTRTNSSSVVFALSADENAEMAVRQGVPRTNSEKRVLSAPSSDDITDDQTEKNKCKAAKSAPMSKVTVDQQLQTVKPSQKYYLYIQMQLCRKDTLRHWLESNAGDRDWPQMLSWFCELVYAVRCVHSNNLIHRDLKPSNIFFSLAGQIKVGDFGLVTDILTDEDDTMETTGGVGDSLSDSGLGSLSGFHRKRHTGRVGTFLYMSPEQVSERNYTYKVDIYSLGLIFFELLYPFQTGMERVSVLQNVKRLKFPQDFVSQRPNECKLLKRLLAKDPECRPDCDQILANELFANTLQALSSSLLSPSSFSSAKRTRRETSGSSTVSVSA